MLGCEYDIGIFESVSKRLNISGVESADMIFQHLRRGICQCQTEIVILSRYKYPPYPYHGDVPPCIPETLSG